MAKSNLTLQLDTEVIRGARLVAARRGTSISALVAKELADMVQEDARYEAARSRALELMRDATSRGGAPWSREEIHDRPRAR